MTPLINLGLTFCWVGFSEARVEDEVSTTVVLLRAIWLVLHAAAVLSSYSNKDHVLAGFRYYIFIVHVTLYPDSMFMSMF
jgi:hypothetical protein